MLTDGFISIWGKLQYLLSWLEKTCAMSLILKNILYSVSY